jgi:hypothetical protein
MDPEITTVRDTAAVEVEAVVELLELELELKLGGREDPAECRPAILHRQSSTNGRSLAVDFGIIFHRFKRGFLLT